VEVLAQAAVLLGESYWVAGCELYREGGCLVVRLPGGRRLRYRNARVEERYYERQGLPAGQPKQTLVFDGPRKKGEATYGGKLAENVVQAVCRDLLAGAMLACEREGMEVVVHVHDEIVIEAPLDRAEDALRRLAEVMSRPPGWAAGFPVAVEAFTACRYYKGPVPGSLTVKAQDGRILKLGVKE
jgi:DNA polymerase